MSFRGKKAKTAPAQPTRAQQERLDLSPLDYEYNERFLWPLPPNHSYLYRTPTSLYKRDDSLDEIKNDREALDKYFSTEKKLIRLEQAKQNKWRVGVQPIARRPVEAAPEQQLEEIEIISRAPQMKAFQRYEPSAEMYLAAQPEYGGAPTGRYAPYYAPATSGLSPYTRTQLESIDIKKVADIAKVRAEAKQAKKVYHLERKLGGDPREMVTLEGDDFRRYLGYQRLQKERAQKARQIKQAKREAGITKSATNPYLFRYDEKTGSIVERPMRVKTEPINITKVDGQTWEEFAIPKLKAGRSLADVSEEWEALKREGNVRVSLAMLDKIKKETEPDAVKAARLNRNPKLKEHIEAMKRKSPEEKVYERIAAVEEARVLALAQGLARPSAGLRRAVPQTAYYGGEYLRTKPYNPAKARGMEREAALADIFAINEARRRIYEEAPARRIESALTQAQQRMAGEKIAQEYAAGRILQSLRQ